MIHKDWMVDHHCKTCRHLQYGGGDWFCDHPDNGILAKALWFIEKCPRGSATRRT